MELAFFLIRPFKILYIGIVSLIQVFVKYLFYIIPLAFLVYSFFAPTSRVPYVSSGRTGSIPIGRLLRISGRK